MPKTALNGVNLYYEMSGHGRPAFLFVHGGMCDHRDWARQVRALSPKYTVATLDLRGHGRSSGAFEDCRIDRWADDVNELIAVLKFGPVVLTGHSLATRIVVEAAARRPEQVGALILLDGSRLYGGFSLDEAPNATAGVPTTEQLSGVLDALIGPHMDTAMQARLRKKLAAAPPALMQAAVDAIRDWDVGRADGAFAALRADLPMLVIQSTYHDRFTRRYSLDSKRQRTPYLDFIAAARPGAVIETLTGAGHFSMLERGAEVTSLIEAFALKLGTNTLVKAR